MMTFFEYQVKAGETRMYPKDKKLIYPLLGLAGEVGEVCEKVKKHFRDGDDLDKDALTLELGDVLWYICAVSCDLDIALQDVAEANIAKLASRKERNKIKGSGDNR